MPTETATHQNSPQAEPSESEAMKFANLLFTAYERQRKREKLDLSKPKP
jgi:hypothetical protein